MQRWVGLGVIADNIIQIGGALAVQRGVGLDPALDPQRKRVGENRIYKQMRTVSRERQGLFRSGYFATESS